MTARPRVILIGYGNPGRLDDGLGPELAARIERLALPGVRVESAYQLAVEDAATIAEYDVAIFADAATDSAGSFYFRAIAPEDGVTFSTHALTPPQVLGLARSLFGAATDGYVLGVRGHAFNAFGEGLSVEARADLAAAEGFIAERLQTGDFTTARAGGGSAAAARASAYEVELCRTERR